ncbi:MAG TPA: CRISPR system precrRNA processing endoribonuclease RAMP protein Cas6 [Bryobacteraceae bacterium]|nr:CRISPR system precrRNA processing endoribonuclease RAMP protein Cas6 [Bryobacteraceae bacterium]
MQFRFYPLRFEFIAKDSLYFPPGKAANILRGALGVIFRRIACVPQCAGARVCEMRESCPYARVFEPAAHDGAAFPKSPSGLADWPRPFVFRARHLDGRTIAPGDRFHFDLNLFSLEPNVLACFVLTFASIVQEGLGPRRGKAELLQVELLSAEGVPQQIVYEHSTRTIAAALSPVSLDLTPCAGAPSKIRVEFLTPTELKYEDRIAPRPEFPILFGRIRDRVATLSRLYGAGPLDIDYRGTNSRAARITMTSCRLKRQEIERRSGRTGQTHSIGGFTGSAEYEGDFTEFLPFVIAAKWTGVGRQSVWGKGELAVGPIAPAGCC